MSGPGILWEGWGQSVLGRVHFGKWTRPSWYLGWPDLFRSASWYLDWNVVTSSGQSVLGRVHFGKWTRPTTWQSFNNLTPLIIGLEPVPVTTCCIIELLKRRWNECRIKYWTSFLSRIVNRTLHQKPDCPVKYRTPGNPKYCSLAVGAGLATHAHNTNYY